jgi:hypothetical protein
VRTGRKGIPRWAEPVQRIQKKFDRLNLFEVNHAKQTGKTPQSPVKTGNDLKPPMQNTINISQNTGKFVDSRREKGPEDGQN